MKKTLQSVYEECSAANRLGIRFFNLVFGVGAVIVLLTKVARLQVAIGQRSEQPWGFIVASTKWLLDYSAGYVRRGLCGTVIHWMYNQFGVEPQWTIICFSVTCYVVVTVITFWFVRRRNLCWWPIVLTICLGGFEMADRDGLAMLLLMIIFYIVGNVKKVWTRYLAVNLVGILVVHVHEMSCFAMMPLLAGLSFFDRQVKTPPWLRPVVLLPIMLAFGCVATHKGSPEMAEKIIGNWQMILPPWWLGVDFNGIRCDIGLSVRSVLRTFYVTMFSTWHHIPHFVLFGCEAVAAFVVVAKLPFFRRDDEVGGCILPWLLIVELGAIIVVFPCFHDYSRLFGFWTFSCFVCFVLIPQEKWISIRDLCVQSPLGGICAVLDSAMRRIPRYLVLLLALSVGMSEICFRPELSFKRSIVGQYVCALFLDVYQAKGDFHAWWYRQAYRN